MNILEETISRLEQKMLSSLENLEADYEAKLQKLKGEIADMERSHKEEKEELKVNFENISTKRFFNNLYIFHRKNTSLPFTKFIIDILRI